MPDLPDGSIGSATWPGALKTMEECGELVQVLAKLSAFPGGTYPDGTDLRANLVEELGDVRAAIEYLAWASGLDRNAIDRRVESKVHRFRHWHHEERIPARRTQGGPSIGATEGRPDA